MYDCYIVGGNNVMDLPLMNGKETEVAPAAAGAGAGDEAPAVVDPAIAVASPDEPAAEAAVDPIVIAEPVSQPASVAGGNDSEAPTETPAAKAVAQPVIDATTETVDVAEPVADPDKPKRRGWWQRGKLF